MEEIKTQPITFYTDKKCKEITAVFGDSATKVIKNEDSTSENNILLDGYAHIGQHQQLTTSYIKENCRISKYEEYKDLLKELINLIGYKHILCANDGQLYN